MAGLPTLDAVRAYIGVSVEQVSDADLGRIYDAAQVEQGQLCRVPADPEPLPEPLAQALLRRVQREVAAKALPLGLVGPEAGDFGPVSVPYFDSLVEAHERGYRKVVVG